MQILVLEDNPERIAYFKRGLIGHIVYFVKTPREAISHLRSNSIDILFLDHDLAGTGLPEPSGPGTGYEVAAWLEEHSEFLPNKIYLHSLNPNGRARMKAALPTAVETPFVWKSL